MLFPVKTKRAFSPHLCNMRNCSLDLPLLLTRNTPLASSGSRPTHVCIALEKGGGYAWKANRAHGGTTHVFLPFPLFHFRLVLPAQEQHFVARLDPQHGQLALLLVHAAAGREEQGAVGPLEVVPLGTVAEAVIVQDDETRLPPSAFAGGALILEQELEKRPR